jgi:hypothetical protein
MVLVPLCLYTAKDRISIVLPLLLLAATTTAQNDRTSKLNEMHQRYPAYDVASLFKTTSLSTSVLNDVISLSTHKSKRGMRRE